MEFCSLPTEVASRVVHVLCFPNRTRFNHVVYADDVKSDKLVMSYRLVNRLFNREILHHYFGGNVTVLGEVEERSLAAVRYNNLLARRLLQAQALRLHGTDQVLSELKIRLRDVITEVRKRHAQILPYRPSHNMWSVLAHQSITGLNGDLDDPASIVVCDAIMSYYSHQYVRQALVPRASRKQIVTSEPVEFWVFLTACFSGDLDCVEATYTTLRLAALNSHVEPATLALHLSSCLHVAAREGHRDIARYLISHGADLRAEVSFDPLAATALESALLAGADTGQVETLRLLLPLSPQSDAPRIKARILWIGCKLNYVHLVQFILQTGSVDAYRLREYAARLQQHSFGNCVSIAAGHGYESCVQLVLRNQHRFTPAPPGWKVEFMRHGVLAILSANRLDMFTEIAPYLDSRDALLYGAGVDGGIEHAFKVRGPFDLGEKFDLPNNIHENTLGSEALRRSVYRRRVENVKILLGLGVKITKEVIVNSSIRQDPRWAETIERLFTQAGHRGNLDPLGFAFVPS